MLCKRECQTRKTKCYFTSLERERAARTRKIKVASSLLSIRRGSIIFSLERAPIQCKSLVCSSEIKKKAFAEECMHTMVCKDNGCEQQDGSFCYLTSRVPGHALKICIRISIYICYIGLKNK